MNRRMMLEFITTNARQMYVGEPHDFEHAPMAFLFSPKGMQIGVLAIPKELYHAVYCEFVKHGATVVGYVAEGWMANAGWGPDATPAERQRALDDFAARTQAAGSISNLPPDDRIETLIVQVADAEGLTSWYRRIVRRAGESVRLEKLPFDDPRETDDVESRFLGHLPWPVPR